MHIIQSAWLTDAPVRGEFQRPSILWKEVRGAFAKRRGRQLSKHVSGFWGRDAILKLVLREEGIFAVPRKVITTVQHDYFRLYEKLIAAPED